MGDWSTLATDVQQWTMNELVTSTVIYNTILPIVEEQLSRDLLDVAGLYSSASGTLTASSRILPVPTNLIGARSVMLTSSNQYVILEYKDYPFLNAYAPIATEYGEPLYYGRATLSTFEVVPTPSQAYVYYINYDGKPAALSSTNTTNWYTTYAYGALLAGCMKQAAMFVLDDRQQGLIQTWTAEYGRQIAAINLTARRQDRDDVRSDYLPQENTSG